MEGNNEKNKQQDSTLKPYLIEDCISNIILSLPIESLRQSMLVSKTWYSIIKSSTFVDSHLNRSENVLIFFSKATQEPPRLKGKDSIFQENPNTYSVEAKLFGLSMVPLFHPHLNLSSRVFIGFVEIRDGKIRIGDFNLTCFGDVKASCNGLILMENKIKKGGLVIVNPITREFYVLPLGTLCLPKNESFGFSFRASTNQYKLVHLFKDEFSYMGCEILDIGNRTWTVVDGPPSSFFTWLGYNPVSAIGALHWVPNFGYSNYIVSMSMENDEFHKVPLPASFGTHDRLLEMKGMLCFVEQKHQNQFDIWVLRNLCEEKWTKYHSIDVSGLVGLVPVCCTRLSDQMIFQSCQEKSMFAYDFRFGEIKKVGVDLGSDWFTGGCIPHVNSLVSLVNK